MLDETQTKLSKRKQRGKGKRHYTEDLYGQGDSLRRAGRKGMTIMEN